MGPTERTATDSGDSELMDSKTKALLDAIGQAEECRRDDPMECICHTCWAKVRDAVKVIDPESFAAEALDRQVSDRKERVRRHRVIRCGWHGRTPVVCRWAVGDGEVVFG